MKNDWITSEFLTNFVATLEADGFVSNEHAFTPYRQAIVKNLFQIQEALKNSGFVVGMLNSGETKSPYGTVYFVYDSKKNHTHNMEAKVLSWMKTEYALEDE